MLIFDNNKFKVEKCTLDNITIVFRSFKDIQYCENPVDSIQKLLKCQT